MSANPHHASRFVATAILLSGIGLTGCSAVKAANEVRHDVANNRETVAAFTSQIKSSEATPFEATYVTTGSAPATIVYAVTPPKGLLFSDTPSGNGAPRLDIIVNASGEFSCAAKSAAGARPSCRKLGAAKAAAQNKIFDFYTPSHWVTFLQDFSLAAGFAGDTVGSSTKTVNGFSMKCVDFHATGVAGKSTICTTAQGILGYVKVASDKTRFEIKSYSATPQPSLFALPAGAKVTNLRNAATR